MGKVEDNVQFYILTLISCGITFRVDSVLGIIKEIFYTNQKSCTDNYSDLDIISCVCEALQGLMILVEEAGLIDEKTRGNEVFDMAGNSRLSH